MMKKKEAVAEFTEDALILQHAKAALLVCVLDATYAVFQTVLARLVPTLQRMPKLEFISSCSKMLIFLVPFYSYGLICQS